MIIAVLSLGVATVFILGTIISVIREEKELAGKTSTSFATPVT